MGTITKTITLNVPVSVVYEAVKSIGAENIKDKHCSDFSLTQHQKNVPSLSEDITNSKLAFTKSGFLSDLKHEYLFKSINENACEVTYIVNFKGYVKLSVEQGVIAELVALKMLEYGYNKK